MDRDLMAPKPGNHGTSAIAAGGILHVCTVGTRRTRRRDKTPAGAATEFPLLLLPPPLLRWLGPSPMKVGEGFFSPSERRTTEETERSCGP